MEKWVEIEKKNWINLGLVSELYSEQRECYSDYMVVAQTRDRKICVGVYSTKEEAKEAMRKMVCERSV